MKNTYKIEVDCANCANKMEQAINKLEGVAEAGINFMALKLNVEFADGADVAQVLKKIEETCAKIDGDFCLYK